MDLKIKEMQRRILGVFSSQTTDFALAGGTALELYYFHHRFSWDLDFFSPKYNPADINRVVSAIEKQVDKRIKLESEFSVAGRARVRFYSMPVKGASRPLKIDFVEDVLFKRPNIVRNKGVRVYSAENIYLQKVMAIAGMQPSVDEMGRTIHQGRNEARDVFDLYWLSREIKPLHQFLKGISLSVQKGLIYWYRTYSRQDLKLALLDMEIYDPAFNAREMISRLDEEIKLFVQGVIEE